MSYDYNYKYGAKIGSMVGKVMVSAKAENDELTFTDGEGNRYIFAHEQGCCESVEIESIEGDLDDLIVFPILLAEEVSSDLGPKSKYDDSYTWTFYKFATIRGTVVVRWYGTSNGYYGEDVDFFIIPSKEAVQ
jgi:hypothetical protein